MTAASKSEHIMVDLETMGSRPGCAIATIGAVMFDPITGTQGDSLYLRVRLQSCVELGLTLDPETVLWWLRQSDEARLELQGDGLCLTAALECFARFLRDHGARYFWSHGASFDGPILEAAYHAIKKSAPWRYVDARDTRTLYDLAGVKPNRLNGVAHNAQVDAENQVNAVFEAYRRLGLASDTATEHPTHPADPSARKPRTTEEKRMTETTTLDRTIATGSASPMIGQHCVVRTYSAGVHLGEVVSKDGKNVVLKDARRLWHWKGAFTLNAVAQEGVKTGSRISVAVPTLELTEAIELIPTTEAARASFDAIHE
jgi:hypothetical protein